MRDLFFSLIGGVSALLGWWVGGILVPETPTTKPAPPACHVNGMPVDVPPDAVITRLEWFIPKEVLP